MKRISSKMIWPKHSFFQDIPYFQKGSFFANFWAISPKLLQIFWWKSLYFTRWKCKEKSNLLLFLEKNKWRFPQTSSFLVFFYWPNKKSKSIFEHMRLIKSKGTQGTKTSSAHKVHSTRKTCDLEHLKQIDSWFDYFSF